MPRGTQLSRKIKNGNLGAVREYVEQGGDVNVFSDSLTPLHFAARAGNLETVEYLVNKGADINVVQQRPQGRTPLHYAVKHHLVLRFLLKAGADVNAAPGGISVLGDAVNENDTEAVRILIENGASLEAGGDLMTRAAVTRAGSDRIELLSLLLEHLPVGARNKWGQTALHAAVAPPCAADHEKQRELDLKKVRFLCDRGAAVNARDSEGKTPLHESCLNGYDPAEIVKYLLEQGADVNGLDDHGWTPLHHAAVEGEGRAAVIDVLLKAGADINIRTKSKVLLEDHASFPAGQYALQIALLDLHDDAVLALYPVQEGLLGDLKPKQRKYIDKIKQAKESGDSK